MEINNIDMKLICLESPVFHALIEEVVDRIVAQKQEKPRWVNGSEAMGLLRISSKATLQRLRDEGQIRFSQPMKKHIVYDRQSIMDYLDFHAKDTF